MKINIYLLKNFFLELIWALLYIRLLVFSQFILEVAEKFGLNFFWVHFY